MPSPARPPFYCRALLFDLDGVLVDSRRVVERTWERWAERHQLDPWPIIRIAHGRRARDTLRDIHPHLAVDDEIAWLDDCELNDLEGLRAIPGAKELLASLPRDRWAIVTSCGRALAELRLGAVGIASPDVFVVTTDVPRGKPAPDGYLLGASRLGVPASECFVFEDAPPGIAAARAAGARVIGVATTHPAADLRDVAAIVPDLAGVRVRTQRDGLALSV
ncbi:MAG TPA: HAD-IA family hydrolase [Gemmatimonadales bacterium]|nr:HAD-IA family hydrolase [Gemmatimonadales bacterium]